jgi:hypothetical protein
MTRDQVALYDSIRTGRADLRCECSGECGRTHKFGANRRCPNKCGIDAVHGRKTVVSLTVTHLDGNKRNDREDNLIALCQGCLQRHRGVVKRKAERDAERRAIEAQHEPLFDIAALTGSAE